MPRVPSNMPRPNAPVEMIERNPVVVDANESLVGSTTPALDTAFEVSSKPVFEAYFTPYDNAAKAEIAMLDKVLEAKKADPNQYTAENNPYKIEYAVYNLRSQKIISKLIEASKAGIDVQVLIESSQITPEKTWNKVDDIFKESGLNVILADREVPLAEREAAHLVGIESNHLMHLKARIFQWKDEDGQIQKSVLSGSMNPGDGASKNDENLNLIEDQSIVDLYQQKFDDVLKHIRTENVWDAERPINVLFTPCKSGPRPIEKIFEWIDQEDEFIMLSVFALKNVKDPETKKTLVEKLGEAKARGAEVVVITDRKKSDGRDAEGNRVEMYGHFASNDWTDEDLEKIGIPVYEFVNESGQYNAMHPKSAIFGLKDMKVVTGAGNWTRSALGSGNKRARNEESFIFVESGRLDQNRTGQRYLSNCLYLLRHYDHQNTEHEPAEELIQRLQNLPNWPTVELHPQDLLPSDFDGEAYLVGEHPALEGAPGELGLRVSTNRSPIHTMMQPSLELPFGTKLSYKVQEHGSGTPEHTGEKSLILIPENIRNPRLPK